MTLDHPAFQRLDPNDRFRLTRLSEPLLMTVLGELARHALPVVVVRGLPKASAFRHVVRQTWLGTTWRALSASDVVPVCHPAWRHFTDGAQQVFIATCPHYVAIAIAPSMHLPAPRPLPMRPDIPEHLVEQFTAEARCAGLDLMLAPHPAWGHPGDSYRHAVLPSVPGAVLEWCESPWTRVPGSYPVEMARCPHHLAVRHTRIPHAWEVDAADQGPETDGYGDNMPGTTMEEFGPAWRTRKLAELAARMHTADAQGHGCQDHGSSPTSPLSQE
jgi:hypothetical protein